MRAKDKKLQFVRLCSVLTAQGLQFTKLNSTQLIFDKVSAARLFDPEVKTPYVDSISRIAGDKRRECFKFNQWADRPIK